ncbi:MAG: DUF3341 domain-containing protein [Verrucomicrobiales bacterium]
MADAPLKRTHGYLAEFGSVADLFHAAEKCRDAGFRFWDTHSPFPIHGMDDAMGVKKSILSLFVLIGGCTGALTAVLLQFGTQVGLYPTVVQGKPTNLFTIPAYFPVTFELTVLLSALTSICGCIALNKLPRLHHPLFNSENFKRATDDGFFICIEQKDPQFHPEKTRAFLEEIGGRNIELIEDELA